MDIVFNMNNQNINMWLEIAKIIFPPIIAGVIALVPYFAEIKRTKGKIKFQENLNKLKILKVSLQNYYKIVLGYLYYSNKIEDEQIQRIINQIIETRFEFINALDNCRGILHNDDIDMFINFKRQFIVCEILARNNLLRNETKGKYLSNKFLYGDKDCNTNEFISMYENCLNKISTKINTL